MSDDSAVGGAVSDAVHRMGNMSLKQILEVGLGDLLRDLVARVNTGTATHQEKAILRNLLRDNGMTLGPSPTAVAEAPDVSDLPELDDPDYN